MAAFKAVGNAGKVSDGAKAKLAAAGKPMGPPKKGWCVCCTYLIAYGAQHLCRGAKEHDWDLAHGGRGNGLFKGADARIKSGNLEPNTGASCCSHNCRSIRSGYGRHCGPQLRSPSFYRCGWQ